MELDKKLKNIVEEINSTDPTKDGIVSREVEILIEAYDQEDIKLFVSYVVSDAGWVPKYDLRVHSRDKNLKVHNPCQIARPYAGSRSEGYEISVCLLRFLESSLYQLIKEERMELDKKLKNIVEEINSTDPTKDGIVSREVEILIEAYDQEDIKLFVSYVVSDAGWVPKYDLRVHSRDKNLKVLYFGLVTQSTGEDWVDAKISLSTASPSTGGRSSHAWYPLPTLTHPSQGLPTLGTHELYSRMSNSGASRSGGASVRRKKSGNNNRHRHSSTPTTYDRLGTPDSVISSDRLSIVTSGTLSLRRKPRSIVHVSNLFVPDRQTILHKGRFSIIGWCIVWNALQTCNFYCTFLSLSLSLSVSLSVSLSLSLSISLSLTLSTPFREGY
eukprot:sb/3465599/